MPSGRGSPRPKTYLAWTPTHTPQVSNSSLTQTLATHADKLKNDLAESADSATKVMREGINEIRQDLSYVAEDVVQTGEELKTGVKEMKVGVGGAVRSATETTGKNLKNWAGAAAGAAIW